jgi:hypothetical protein
MANFMSKILAETYYTLSDFMISSKMHYQVRKFKDLGVRMLSSDLSNLELINFQHNTLQYDPWFFQRPSLLIHDQEPMYFNGQKKDWLQYHFNTTAFDDRAIVLTSELNSKELDDYCQTTGAKSCYWFSNGALALEWYQNGRWNLQNSKSLDTRKGLRYKFSAMNRLIDQQRSYRPVISKILLDTVDNKFLRLSCNLTDPISKKTAMDLDIPQRYKALFKKMDMTAPILMNVMPEDLSPTGDIQNKSYAISGSYFSRVFCHIVTETLFMDDTLHLTEKSLRPIVNQRPFLMLGPPGSLGLLRRYGFKTFSQYWSEDYDDITDPWARLDAVVEIIHKLDKLSLDDMEDMLLDMQNITLYNFNHFYGDFGNIVYEELIANLKAAVNHHGQRTPKGWMIKRIESLSEAELQNMINGQINDEIDNFELFDGYNNADYTKIDRNLARFLVYHLNVDKKASKEEILASLMSLL